MTNKAYKVLHNTGQDGMPCGCCRKGLKAMHRRIARRAVKADTRKAVREGA